VGVTVGGSVEVGEETGLDAKSMLWRLLVDRPGDVGESGPTATVADSGPPLESRGEQGVDVREEVFGGGGAGEKKSHTFSPGPRRFLIISWKERTSLVDCRGIMGGFLSKKV